ncbi:MAG: NIPSNAP family protein [Acetobacteraceae bacterium]|nr:NIPSNAP family protein [Acetobacteraceae bacterium]MBV8576867.1 NIPSNAP family protein [Acetobacteraceae bacterium]
MLVDHRTYTVRPGTIAKHMKLYEEHGLAVQKRHLGEPLAWLVTETGELNTFVHIWVYQDAADRERRRAAMNADPEWQAFLQKSAEAGYLIRQENKLMTPAPFASIAR